MSTPIMNCTARSPMPSDADQVGQSWYHHGAAKVAGPFPEAPKEGDKVQYRCPNCGSTFTLTYGKKRKVDAEFIREAQRKAAEMRARGLRPDTGDA